MFVISCSTEPEDSVESSPIVGVWDMVKSDYLLYSSSNPDSITYQNTTLVADGYNYQQLIFTGNGNYFSETCSLYPYAIVINGTTITDEQICSECLDGNYEFIDNFLITSGSYYYLSPHTNLNSENNQISVTTHEYIITNDTLSLLSRAGWLDLQGNETIYVRRD